MVAVRGMMRTAARVDMVVVGMAVDGEVVEAAVDTKSTSAAVFNTIRNQLMFVFSLQYVLYEKYDQFIYVSSIIILNLV